MKTRVRIELVDVVCRDTEDVTGADDFYLVGGVSTSDGKQVRDVLTAPLHINDGQRKPFFPQDQIVFDDMVDDSEVLGLGVQAFDEDGSKDWKKAADWSKDIAPYVGEGVKVIVDIFASSSKAKKAGAIADKVAKIATDAFGKLANLDKDDSLGTMKVVVPAAGPAVEERQAQFKHSDIWWYSDWDYTVNYRITRHEPSLLVNVTPSPLKPATKTQITVKASDRDTLKLVAGKVLIDGKQVGTTGTAFPFQADQTTQGIIQAPDYVDTPFQIMVSSTMTATVDPNPATPFVMSVVTVHATDPNGAPVAGSVIIDGVAIGATNQPFSYTYHPKPIIPFPFPGGVLEFVHGTAPEVVAVGAGGHGAAAAAPAPAAAPGAIAYLPVVVRVVPTNPTITPVNVSVRFK